MYGYILAGTREIVVKDRYNHMLTLYVFDKCTVPDTAHDPKGLQECP